MPRLYYAVMGNGVRLERVSKRTYRVRGAQRNAQGEASRRTPDAPQESRFAMLSRFATGTQRHVLPRRSADP